MQRVVGRKERFIPTGQAFPNGTAFEPSRDDEREATERDHPVRVSVWNRALTTPRQAAEQRVAAQARRGMASEAADYGVFALGVGDVLAAAAWCEAQGLGADLRERVRVVHDPLEPEDGPGWEGHAGIEGLDRPTGSQKVLFKALRDEIARRCKELPLEG